MEKEKVVQNEQLNEIISTLKPININIEKLTTLDSQKFLNQLQKMR